jgi:nucleotide-binding universal stress UspA family protein
MIRMLADRPIRGRYDGEVNSTIMCGVDGSDGGVDAARVAGELSRRLAVGLLLVHVSEPVARFRMSPESFAAGLEFEREQAKAALTDGARASGIGDDAELLAETGEPARRLLELAEERGVDLIIVGSRGRGAWMSAILGSVSGHLAANAPCPVVIVPHPSKSQVVTG